MRTSTARVTAAVSLALTATVAAASSAYAAPAAAGTGITLAPAHSSPGDNQTRSYFLRKVSVGSGYSDEVRVTNGSASAVTLNVVPVDGITASGTGADYGQHAATGDGRWIHPATTTIRVAAHSSALEPFRVTVPTGARAGDHLAGLAFVDPTAKTSTRGSLSIRTVYRNVMGVETVVPGVAPSKFALTAQAAGAGVGTGLATATVDIANVGNLLDKGKLQVTLQKTGYTHTATQQLGLILPRTSVHYVLAWPTSLATGHYTMTSVLSGADFATVRLVSSVTIARQLAGGPTAAIHPFSTSDTQTAQEPRAIVAGPAAGTAGSTHPAKHHLALAAAVVGSIAGGLALVVALTLAFFVGARRRRDDAPVVTATRAEELVDA